MVGYTLWQQTAVTGSAGAELPYTLGTQFVVAVDCILTGIWWYSPAGAAALPTVCGVWDIANIAAIAEDGDPWWQSGGSNALPGDGWVRDDFTAAGVVLAAGNPYAVAVWQPASVAWYIAESGYWDSGAGADGLADGPLSAPDDADSVNGQGCYDTTGIWTFPGTSPGDGESFYADPEVIPVTGNVVPAAPPVMTGRVAVVAIQIGGGSR